MSKRASKNKRKGDVELQKFGSQITFLYFEKIDEAFNFFENTLGLEIADDQGTARIYKLAGGAFIGAVDSASGHCRAQSKNAVLITLVTEDVQGCYEALKAKGIVMQTPVQRPASFPVECFFFTGPGGYEFEVQRFLKEETAKLFR